MTETPPHVLIALAVVTAAAPSSPANAVETTCHLASQTQKAGCYVSTYSCVMTRADGRMRTINKVTRSCPSSWGLRPARDYFGSGFGRKRS